MTSSGYERSAAAGPVDDRSAPDETAPYEWDDPLTRLLLLLEIAERPAWLRDIAHSAAAHGAR